MTPKEKAIELANKYYNDVAIELDNEFVFIPKDLCKQCALIAVDEILILVTAMDGKEYWQEYYEEVKQEIEKL